MILALLGRMGRYPFLNEPPTLRSVNGVAVQQSQGSVTQQLVLDDAAAGERVRLRVEAEDPDGDRFQVWFPEVTGTVEFDPDARTGAIVFSADEDPTGVLMTCATCATRRSERPGTCRSGVRPGRARRARRRRTGYCVRQRFPGFTNPSSTATAGASSPPSSSR